MEASGGKHIVPKDGQINVLMMKDLGIVEYYQQVLNHLLEFNYRYTTQLLDDAKAFSNLAKKKNVDANDVKLAIQMAQKGVFRRPPPREDNKTTAAGMLVDSRRIEIEHQPLPQSSQMKRALDAEFQEMIKNSQSGQESIGKNDKDKIMDA
ncbi:hypothetical protein QTP88_023761 [Uroleucon formosanum]